MLVSLFRYIQGYLKIRITGYSPERFLNLCKNKKIAVWGLESSHNAYEMYINVSGFRKLKPILRKTKTKATILERVGLPFFLHKYRKRKLFFAGGMLCLCMIYIMTFFIWNIDLQGNQTITDDVLMEFLQSQDIEHGMAKHKVDCEQIAKDIRKAFNDIIWVSASLEGTRLFIQVKENTDTFEKEIASEEPSDIVAEQAGVVVSMVTRSGVPQVDVGDEVLAGDMLVSGSIEVLNDAKEVVNYRYVHSDADIVVETILQYEDFIPSEYEQKEYTNKSKKMIYLKLGNYALRLGLKKHSYENWDRETEEVQMKVGENFYLPIFIGKKTIQEYKFEPMEYSAKELENLLNENFERYCEELEEKNAIILDKKLYITHDAQGAKASASLTVHQTIGIQRKIVDF